MQPNTGKSHFVVYLHCERWLLAATSPKRWVGVAEIQKVEKLAQGMPFASPMRNLRFWPMWPGIEGPEC